MTSWKSMFLFTATNMLLTGMAYIQSFFADDVFDLYDYGTDMSQPSMPSIMCAVASAHCITLMRNLAVVHIVSYRMQKKDTFVLRQSQRYLHDKEDPIELYTNLLTTSSIEALTFLLTYTHHLVSPVTRPLWLDLAHFIPISFFMEIVFDFFHYVSHRWLHRSRAMYVNVHSHHHRFKRPTPLSTFYQDPLDVFLTNSVPLALTLLITSRVLDVSRFQYSMFLICKTYIETSGHSCKTLAPSSSFIQCMWLPRLFGIELYSEDHALHHLVNSCNFGKRFSLWDRVFGTYRRGVDYAAQASQH